MLYRNESHHRWQFRKITDPVEDQLIVSADDCDPGAGFGYLGSLAITELAQAPLEALAHEVRQSCSMAVLDGQASLLRASMPWST